MRPISHQLDVEIRTVVSESLRCCSSGQEAQAWLMERHLLPKVEELAATNAAALSQLEAAQSPTIAILNHSQLIHYGLLASAGPETLKQLLLAVESPVALRYFPQSGIWRTYSSAFVAFVRRLPFAMPAIKPKGYERFFIPYIAYMSAISSDHRDAARKDMADSFKQRNADRRFKDWDGLDGDGEKPVRWDFRAFTLGLVA